MLRMIIGVTALAPPAGAVSHAGGSGHRQHRSQIRHVLDPHLRDLRIRRAPPGDLLDKAGAIPCLGDDGEGLIRCESRSC